MAFNTDWLPHKREEQLAMTKNWLSVFSEKVPGADGAEVHKHEAWGIPAEVVSELGARCAEAEAALAMAKNADTRTAVVNQRCRTAFMNLTALLRDVKDRHFKKNPLTDADFVSLGVRIKDTTPTVIKAPTAQAEADISYPGPHLLSLHLRPLAGTTLDPRADYGGGIHWGVMPHGGATIEEAVGAGRYLMKPPVSGAELPHSKFTRRKKETFDFLPTDSGKTAFFSVRLENSKGDKGPWGPIVTAVIP